jgi:putative FmdB family regulatory protein
MAYFDYHCEKCGKDFEIQCGINDDRSNVKCGHCGSKKVQRAFDSIYLPKKGGGEAAAGSSIGYRGRGSGASACGSCSSGNCSTCG